MDVYSLRIRGGVFFASVLFSIVSFAQRDRYPATVTPIINPPYSLFLEDYTDPSSQLMIANVLFNDFNETSWTFKLNLRISSVEGNIQLQTKEGFMPSRPITLVPGEPYQFGAGDWMEYLNPENLIISGGGANLLNQRGRLPEGYYEFCMQILDFETGEPLSPFSCSSVWMQLTDPPQITSPLCGQYIDPKTAQLPIQWHLFDNKSPNDLLGTNYIVHVWELTQPNANPITAVQNGQALKIFESEPVHQSTFIYGPSEPALQKGKTYAFQIEALDQDGKDRFKNNGRSEFCHFHFGWPENGKIPLIHPEKDAYLNKKDVPTLIWGAPDNLLPGQGVEYEVTVVEKKENQTHKNAIRNNNRWHYRKTPKTFTDQQQIDTFSTIDPMQEYTWMVKAYSDFQEVARSSLSNFFGPNLMDYFYAGNHKVIVTNLQGKDLSKISGSGKIKIEENEDPVKISFTNLEILDKGGYYVLKEGEIILKRESILPLSPKKRENGKAQFITSKYRLNKDGLSVYGHFEWSLPFPSTSPTKENILSKSKWIHYDDFTLYGGIRLRPDGNNFELLDPFGFNLALDSSSFVYFNDNIYSMDLNGKISVPESIEGKSQERVAYSFREEKQLFYLKSQTDNLYAANEIRLISNTGIWALPTKYSIDLSDSVSSTGFSDIWKGIAVEEYVLSIDRSPDDLGQIILAEKYVETVDDPFTISTRGINLKHKISSEKIDYHFQSFPASALEISLLIKQNRVHEESKLTGDFLLPVVDTVNHFQFVSPISTYGFTRGYLTDLEGTSFVHNPEGGDQKLSIEIERADFKANERIDMVLNIAWPALNVTFKKVRGFKVWGDYTIGFGEKDGSVALVEQVNTEMKGYPATCKIIGAGSNEGYYAFATTVDIMLGEDVSGGKEAPQANIYSLMYNSYAPKELTGPVKAYKNKSLIKKDSLQSNETEKSAEDFAKILNQKSGDISKGAQALKDQYASIPSTKYSASDIYTGDDSQKNEVETEFDSASGFNQKQQELIRDISRGLVTELTIQLMRPVDSKIDSLNKNIERKTIELLTKAQTQIDDVVSAITRKISKDLIKLLKNDKIDVSSPISRVADATKNSIVAEINNSLYVSAEDNIIIPVRVLLQDNIKGRIRSHIVENGSEAIYFTILGDGKSSKKAFDALVKDMPHVIKDILSDASKFVSYENIESTIKGLIQDAINNIDVKAITHSIRFQAEEIIKDEINRAIADAVSDALGDQLGEVGISGLNDAPLDFVGVGSRLAKGDVKGALALDPIHVKLNTPVIGLDGYIEYTPDNPTYGDVWTGDIDMAIKVPRPFAMNAVYINGRKDDLSYWFVQVSPPRGDGQPYSIGAPLPKKVKPLPQPADLGIAKVMAASGRLYHHMREEPSGVIVPDPEMRYGAYMHFVFYDVKNEGKNMRLEVAGEINSKENGDFTVAFDGNMQLNSERPRILEGDKYAAIQGSVMVRYNSAEKHFLGYAKVILNKPKEICAEGSLLVDVKPKKWRVALGSREERLVFVPGCMGWSPTGWLDLNQSVAEIGLGLQWSMTGTYPSSDVPLIIGPYNARFVVDAGLAFGVLAAIQYRPFALQKAGIWADLWAIVILQHKPIYKKKWKSKTLVDILLKGDLILYFVPKPTTLEGNLRGHIKVLFFNKQINATVVKEIS